MDIYQLGASGGENDRDRMFFYGQALPALAVVARVIDNATFQWLQEFHHNYTTYIGGSRSAERGGKAQLRVDGKIFTGYITQMSFNTSAWGRGMGANAGRLYSPLYARLRFGNW